MAWTVDAQGRMVCDEHAVTFGRGRSCPTCALDSRNPSNASVAVPTLGQFEQLVAKAQADGLPDRATVIKFLIDRIKRGTREATRYGRRSREILDKGIFKRVVVDGEERLIDADADSAAVKWAALDQMAGGRVDKLVRALLTITAETERIADLERRERLASSLPAASTPRTIQRGSA